LRVKSKKKNTI